MSRGYKLGSWEEAGKDRLFLLFSLVAHGLFTKDTTHDHSVYVEVAREFNVCRGLDHEHALVPKSIHEIIDDILRTSATKFTQFLPISMYADESIKRATTALNILKHNASERKSKLSALGAASLSKTSQASSSRTASSHSVLNDLTIVLSKLHHSPKAVAKMLQELLKKQYLATGKLDIAAANEFASHMNLFPHETSMTGSGFMRLLTVTLLEKGGATPKECSDLYPVIESQTESLEYLRKSREESIKKNPYKAASAVEYFATVITQMLRLPPTLYDIITSSDAETKALNKGSNIHPQSHLGNGSSYGNGTAQPLAEAPPAVSTATASLIDSLLDKITRIQNFRDERNSQAISQLQENHDAVKQRNDELVKTMKTHHKEAKAREAEIVRAKRKRMDDADMAERELIDLQREQSLEADRIDSTIIESITEVMAMLKERVAKKQKQSDPTSA